MMNEKQIDQIERYILDEMSTDEREQFETQLKLDKELAADLDILIRIAAEAERHAIGDIKQNIKNAEQKYADGIEQKNIRKLRFPLRRTVMMSAAASFLVLFTLTIIIYYTQTSHKRIFNDYFEPYPNTFVDYSRGSEVPLGYKHLSSEQYNLCIRAVKLYELGRYTAAASLLEKNIALKPQNADFLFIQAVSLLGAGKETGSIELLNYLEQLGLNHKYPLKWYMALANLKMNDETLAMQNLKKSIDLNEGFNAKARQLMNELEGE